MNRTIRILLADDHQLFCEGIGALLGQQPDLQVIAVARDGREAVQLARTHHPDVVVMDVAMPQLNGIEATRQLHDELPQLRVIALSMHADRRYVTGMLAAGAAGYLLKDCAAEELVRAIRTVVAHQVYLSPAIAGVVVEDVARRRLPSSTGDPPTDRLTPRETEVLQLLAEGRSAREIASTLHLSVKTVETHRRHIMERLEVHSLAELTKYAIREGITNVEP